MSAAAPPVSADATPTLLHERWRLPLLLLGVAAVAIATLYFWLTGGRYMSTDDAYVQAARASISSNVSGKVVAIAVVDNQRVKRGDLLFQLDDQPYRIAVAAARAKLGTVQLQVGVDKATYRQRLAALAAAKDTLDYQQKEYERRQKLRADGVVTQAQFDQAKHAFEEARQQMEAAQHQVDSALAALGGDPNIDPARHPAVQATQAELDRAELNLSYTRITAPDDGIVTKVEQLHAGDYVEAANPVFALISTHDVWVEANFKEDQLTHMRIDQPATVDIDTYPGQTFKARVASIAPGTGSQFSALPPENATGNWVKVVQRVPVRLEFSGNNPDVPLHSGLSADVSVDTGHRRRFPGADHE
jgi:membrane fusion protein (multidrug efflux system)